MTRTRKETNGRYTNDWEPEELLDVMEENEPYITPEITEMVDLPHSTTNRYLNLLADDGKIRKKKPSKRIVIWIKE